ncbi:hypothetical protein BJX70DRAFT_385238 [Aspergillus crustosus]
MSLIRRRPFTRRSRTGCRTCRIRHVKCDETPGACRNCSDNGWACEGYELNRLPRRAPPPIPSSSPASSTSPPSITPAPIATGFRWATTADEKRCVSFFLYRTIPGLTSFNDSSLWQKLVLQMSCTEPAVYHAVVALSAVNQDLERHGIPRPGTNPDSTWHRFALEQSMRSFGLLNKRSLLQDPQLREVLLVCCLLFIMLELVCGHYDDATAHLQNGLAILKEMKIQRRLQGASPAVIEDNLLDAFLHLESQATHHGVRQPPLHLDARLIHEQRYEEYLFEFTTLRDAQQALSPLMNTTFPFLERCWSRPEAEIMATYGTLHAKQQRLLSCITQFGTYFDQFREHYYTTLTRKQQRGADLIRVMYLTLVLNTKICLYTRGCPEPDWFMSGFEQLLTETLVIIDGFEERPLMTIDATILPALFTVAARCPDYTLRYQAIDALRAWPHCEGYLNSSFMAELIEEGMKGELRHLWSEVQADACPLPAGLSFEILKNGGVVACIGSKGTPATRFLSLETNVALRDALMTVESSPEWSCVRASGILPRKGRSERGNKKFLAMYNEASI